MNPLPWLVLSFIALANLSSFTIPAWKADELLIPMLDILVAPFVVLHLYVEAARRRRDAARRVENVRFAREHAHRNRVSRRARKIGRLRKEREGREQTEEVLQADAARREEERIESEAAEVQEAIRREEEMQERLRELIVRCEAFPDYANPQFVENHARQYGRALLREREAILEEYEELHQPPEFAELLKTHAPETFVRATWRVRALALAERFAVEQPPPASPNSGRPPKQTPKAKRAAKVKAYRNTALDRVALKKEELEMTKEAREVLGQYVLDPEELEHRAEELIPPSLEDDDGKHGRTL